MHPFVKKIQAENFLLHIQTNYDAKSFYRSQQIFRRNQFAPTSRAEEAPINKKEAGSFETSLATYIKLDDVTSHNTMYSLNAHIYRCENLQQMSYIYLHNIALSYFNSSDRHQNYKSEL
jgi:hypothetical protein